MSNFAVKLTNPTYGTVAFDVVSPSADTKVAAAAKALADTGYSYLGVPGTNADTMIAELISDQTPDLYGRIDSNFADDPWKGG